MNLVFLELFCNPDAGAVVTPLLNPQIFNY